MVSWLQQLLPQWTVRRVPLSGAVEGYKGDIHLQHNHFQIECTVECKNRKNLAPLIRRLKELKGSSDLLILSAGRDVWLAGELENPLIIPKTAKKKEEEEDEKPDA